MSGDYNAAWAALSSISLASAQRCPPGNDYAALQWRFTAGCAARFLEGACHSIRTATDTKPQMQIRVFFLEYQAADGTRTYWREALPARTAFTAARQMALDGLQPKVIAVRMDSAVFSTPGRFRSQKHYDNFHQRGNGRNERPEKQQTRNADPGPI